MAYWLMKCEPAVYSMNDLVADQNTCWEGVRNYQARNMLRDQMQVGDRAFFYHSNCAEPGIVGIMQITRAGYVDHTAFDPDAKYYDPKSDPANPRWYMVDVQHERTLTRTITLRELKPYADNELQGLPLVRKGNRLSVMPFTPEQWQFVLNLE
ncbi:MAG: EVE domain-containing protein [Pseudomonadota bacterium]